MKCFVTGATGHIGNVLVRALFDKGYTVTSLVLPKDNAAMIEAYSSIVYGNIMDEAFLEKAFEGHDIVFHLAGIVEIGTGKKKKIFDVNVEGTKNVVRACQASHVRRLVYTSSVHAMPELPNDQIMTETDHFDPNLVKGLYAKSKAMATAYVLSQKDSGLEVVVCQPAGVIGPNDYQLSNMSQLFLDVLMGRLTAYIDGGYNFIDVRDVADGLIAAAEKAKSGECFLLSGEEITVKDLLDYISFYSGKKKIRTKLAFWFILSMSYFAEVYYKLAKQKPLFTHYSIVVLRSNRHFSNAKARNELGFKVRPIYESIRDTLVFAKQQYLVKEGKRYKKKSFGV